MHCRDRQLVALILFVGAIGCGSSDNKDLGVTGTIASRVFQAKSGAFDTISTHSLLLAFLDSEDLCALATSGTTPTDIRWLSVSLCFPQEPSTASVQIVPGNVTGDCTSATAWATVRIMEAGNPSVLEAESGEVTIDSLDELKVTGSLAIHFVDDSEVAGDFELEYCDALNSP
jgi:hypothetical protein